MKALVTAGPTYEPIDPVRFIGNRSSGKQGYAIAEALRDAGFDVTLISGPTIMSDPKGVRTIRVETANEMLEACTNALPANIAVCAAAVSDWSVSQAHEQKLKKREGEDTLTLTLSQTPDILHTLSNHAERPALVVGFAAETEKLESHAKAKLEKKSCDWILANLVAQKDKKIFGEDENQVYLITSSNTEAWPNMSKSDVGERLAQEIKAYFKI